LPVKKKFEVLVFVFSNKLIFILRKRTQTNKKHGIEYNSYDFIKGYFFLLKIALLLIVCVFVLLSDKKKILNKRKYASETYHISFIRRYTRDIVM
jgi:hypothetical protein